MATKLYSFQIHRNRPVFAALERFAHWLCMEYVGSALWTISTHGIRGLLAVERRTIRVDGWRRYLSDAAGFLWGDVKTIPALLIARLIGERGIIALMRGALNAGTLTGEAIIPAYTAIDRTEERIDPVIAARYAQWEAARKEREAAEQAAADAAYEAERANKPPTLNHLLFELWFSLETDEQRERFLLGATELLPFVRFPVENFHCQVYHAAGDHAALLSHLCDGMSADERIEVIGGWREHGLTYLADYYAPLVSERLGITSSNPTAKAA